MTPPNPPTPDDMLAGEFVLGSLDAQDRAMVESRLAEDPDLARMVLAWEQWLHPLSEAAEEVSPPAGAWLAITDRLGWNRAALPESATLLALTRALHRWRLGAAAATALAACLAALVVWQARPIPPEPALVAVLQKAGNDSAILLRADVGDRNMAVRALDASPPAGRSFELWIIDPSLGAPRSLGALDAAAPARHPLPSGVTPAVARRATYAVTVEPPGGSPDGRPSGAPVYTGHLLAEPF